MGLDEAVTKFADPVIASAGGMGCDVMSAYTAQLLGMFGVAMDDPALNQRIVTVFPVATTDSLATLLSC